MSTNVGSMHETCPLDPPSKKSLLTLLELAASANFRIVLRDSHVLGIHMYYFLLFPVLSFSFGCLRPRCYHKGSTSLVYPQPSSPHRQKAWNRAASTHFRGNHHPASRRSLRTHGKRESVSRAPVAGSRSLVCDKGRRKKKVSSTCASTRRPSRGRRRKNLSHQ